MEIPDAAVWGAVASLVGGGLALWRKVEKSDGERGIRIRAVEDEVRGLRTWRHDVVAPYCSHLEAGIVELQTQMKDVSRRLDKINGDRK